MTRALCLLTTLTACANTSVGERPADPTDDTGGGAAPETTLRWSADEARLEPGSFTNWLDGTTQPPPAFSFGGDAIELGVFSPTTAHLTRAQPLDAPAAGAQTYWMNTNPWGNERDRMGQGTLQVAITAATIAGADYHIHAALGQRLDLTAPDITVTLWVLTPGVPENAVRTTFPTMPAGGWTAVDLYWTADRDDAEMYLLIDARGTALTLQQVLIDEITASW
jgi:hypothetical protein